MVRIINYIVNMVPYIVSFIPIYLFLRLIYCKWKQSKKINWNHEIVLFLFISFLIGLASLTVIPKLEITSEGIKIIKTSIGGINLIPLKVIYETYIEVFKYNNMNYFIINFLGNIIMFMPIGFFIALLWKIKDKYVILIGASSSLFIEITQLFIGGRGTDIDDVILNTIGVILGLLIYKLLYKKYKKQMNKFKLI